MERAKGTDYVAIMGDWNTVVWKDRKDNALEGLGREAFEPPPPR